MYLPSLVIKRYIIDVSHERAMTHPILMQTRRQPFQDAFHELAGVTDRIYDPNGALCFSPDFTLNCACSRTSAANVLITELLEIQR